MVCFTRQVQSCEQACARFARSRACNFKLPRSKISEKDIRILKKLGQGASSIVSYHPTGKGFWVGRGQGPVPPPAETRDTLSPLAPDTTAIGRRLPY